ncbi:hypothetical protein PTTG_30788 [Puccinia triticina 1-1 BBBD Race 1]|uniref:Uncharacterized protein n=1 Tax=Puccinia triticina (isolate 1-1 / race 1 (BBBD)) TaxID=630390 RepID=A0A180FXE7_PUCT1|nr:hypothetical protein PTTG_30788 [Puccinia triticina 1-1 BBBD Race 1]
MHFSTSSIIVVTMALVCQLSKAASTPPTKATTVIFKCEDPNTLAACTSVYNRDDNGNALSFTFLPANKVVDPKNPDPTKNILGTTALTQTWRQTTAASRVR